MFKVGTIINIPKANLGIVIRSNIDYVYIFWANKVIEKIDYNCFNRLRRNEWVIDVS
jgi:hypothetical protein